MPVVAREANLLKRPSSNSIKIVDSRFWTYVIFVLGHYAVRFFFLKLGRPETWFYVAGYGCFVAGDSECNISTAQLLRNFKIVVGINDSVNVNIIYY